MNGEGDDCPVIWVEDLGQVEFERLRASYGGLVFRGAPLAPKLSAGLELARENLLRLIANTSANEVSDHVMETLTMVVNIAEWTLARYRTEKEAGSDMTDHWFGQDASRRMVE